MWAHDRTEESHRRTRRPSTDDAGDVRPDAARILALQRTAGNAAVAATISGQHQTVQRVHTDDEEEQSDSAPQQQLGGVLRVANRERAMSARYGIRIGPGDGDGEHFSHALLNRIDAALQQLPIQDLRDNLHLVAIEMDPNPQGSATLYNADTRSIGVVRPVVAAGRRAPQWLYSVLSTDQNWQLSRMDAGAMADYEGITPQGDQALGIAPGSRHVMAPQGNLVRYTIRHEVGHPVDLKFGWSDNLAHLDHFGGWQVHAEDGGPRTVAAAILRNAGLDGVIPGNSPVVLLARRIAADVVRENLTNGELDEYFGIFEPHLPAADFATRTATARRFIALAVAQPWTLDNGGVPTIQEGNRVYQMDHYGQWVSYLAAQRQYRVSNYQFSTPGEWFAEAYTAYYNRAKPQLRARLHPTVQAWFAAHATDDQSESDQGQPSTSQDAPGTSNA